MTGHVVAAATFLLGLAPCTEGTVGDFFWPYTDVELANPCGSWGPGAAILWKARRRLATLPDGGGKDPEARALLLEAAKTCPYEAIVQDEVGEGLRLLGEPDTALDIFDEAALRGVWRHPMQRILRNYRSDLVCPRRAVFSNEELMEYPALVSIAAWVQQKMADLRKEFLEARTNRIGQLIVQQLQTCPGENKKCWRKTLYPHVKRWEAGSWAHYWIVPLGQRYKVPFVWDGDKTACSPAMPIFCELLSEIHESGTPVLQAAISEVRGPTTMIPLHRSGEQGRLRLACTLTTPEKGDSLLHLPRIGEIAYREGACFWFDESFEHEVMHNLEGSRATLFMDISHPGKGISYPDGPCGKKFELKVPNQPPKAPPELGSERKAAREGSWTKDMADTLEPSTPEVAARPAATADRKPQLPTPWELCPSERCQATSPKMDGPGPGPHVCVIAAEALQKARKPHAIAYKTTRNTSKCVKAFLASFDAQVYENWELHMVNALGGAEIFRKEVAIFDNPRISVGPSSKRPFSKSRLGVFDSFNVALEPLLEQGGCDYFLFTVAHNLYSHYLLETILPAMIEGVDMIGFNFISHHCRPSADETGDCKRGLFMQNASFNFGYVDMGAAVFSAEAIRASGARFDSRFYEADWMFMARVLGRPGSRGTRWYEETLLLHQ
eukprot:TRINITY_DN26931_c0_g1_i1.p1 TRINITY_DN26931_c0_g1~~TRINITY_DN26931_c0_g1_i1.p1  ORF type:complete len:667 (+),score=87.18 TRINITY_DN26931_c0_g1_i1:156-2156(+)